MRTRILVSFSCEFFGVHVVRPVVRFWPCIEVQMFWLMGCGAEDEVKAAGIALA